MASFIANFASTSTRFSLSITSSSSSSSTDGQSEPKQIKLRDDWRQRSRPIPPGGTYPAKDHCSYRVIWALELKGIPYEYVEEDLTNKTPSLLQYNPVHKKVPVLIHGGKPICESTVILQYIDETWPENPLLPTDPLDRAVARFWIQFAENKCPAIWRMFCSSGEEQEEAKKESLEMLRIVEEQALGGCGGGGGGGKKFFGGEKIGMVDLVYGVLGEWLGVIEEVMDVKLVESDSFPRLEAWSKAFMEDPVIRQNSPDRHRLLLRFMSLRERMQASYE